MDLGVGSFVFSSGVVSARQPTTSAVRQLMNAFRSSFVILLLGIIRMVLTKNLEYQEHVTEYGVHWNFFVTLGLLPPFVTLFRLISRNRIPFSVFAGIITLTYEWALKNMRIGEYESVMAYIIKAPRTGLVNQNREGIFSFLGIFLTLQCVLMIGYLSIFLFGVDVGRLILPAKPPVFSFIKSSRTATFIALTLCSAISTVAFYISLNFNLGVSRRFVSPFNNLAN